MSTDQILPILLGLCLTLANAAEFQLANQQQLQLDQQHEQQQQQYEQQQLQQQAQLPPLLPHQQLQQQELQQELQQQHQQYEKYTQEQHQLQDELQQQQQQHAQQLLNLQQLRQQQEQDPQQALVSENDLPQKVIAKKSVQDEQAIQAAEAYEFEFLPEGSIDYNGGQNADIEPLASASHDDHHDHHPKVGYSAGGPLVNIAQGAAAAAHNFEKSQPAAAAQAAYVAKNRLGQSAGLAAGTAAAAFAGKQIILRGLEQQAYNAHRALESEKLQLRQAQRAATAAANAAQQAMHQLQVVTTALNAAQATTQHASAAAAEAAAELAAQTAMVGAAKARLQAIEDQLHHARVDFEAAQHASRKAANAAQVAQNNAAAAAAHAAEVANANHHHHHDGDHHGHHSHHHHEKLTDDSDDHDHDESVSVPVASSSQAPGGSVETDRNGHVLHAGVTDRAALATGPNGNKDELYDSYDSYPY